MHPRGAGAAAVMAGAASGSGLRRVLPLTVR
eukprot:COSAG01_NODE_45407_length_409_cov_3.516129_1_plen_30_part_10